MVKQTCLLLCALYVPWEEIVSLKGRVHELSDFAVISSSFNIHPVDGKLCRLNTVICNRLLVTCRDAA